jgi:thioredoxin-dependent peroxiredoxin
MYRSVLGSVKKGSMAPMFSARDVRGEVFDTRAYVGKSGLVLFFYRGHWCSTCREELLGLKRGYADISAHGAGIVAVSVDGPDEARNMAADLDLPYTVISDPGHRIIDMYGVLDSENGMAFITVFLIDKAGVVQYKRPITGTGDMLSAADIVTKLESMDTLF